MTEYGIFSAEGCVSSQHYSSKEAEEALADLVDDPEGYDPGDLEVVEICSEHEEQRADSCEECPND
ncbi:hypothetical protein [Nocardia vulneris]|uniref:hypothetical protein n=1 Tax=Nocardia vulneris TaxID=1141657 RepID=UPI000ADB3A75|nr:hypothetical protein [Nocardia vulneris]